MRTGSRETSVSEAVVCAWTETYPTLRLRLQVRVTSVGSKSNVGS